MAIAQHYQPGTVVVYAGDGLTKRTLAAVVSGPHEGGTFDLECKQRVPPESIRAVMGGERVEYFSASLNNWIPSQVLRKGRLPGTFDLDCKEGVDLRRMRLPKGEAAGAPQQPAQQQQQPPPLQPQQPQQPRPQSRGAPPPQGDRREPSHGSGGPLGLQPGDHCFYKSSTHGWIPAQVARYRPEDTSYDLDVKQRVRQEAIFCLREGEAVEYKSISSGQWIPTRVLRKGREPGIFDLDCKERVDLRRMRPPSGAAPTPSAASRAPAPQAPPPPPPPPAAASAQAQDCHRDAIPSAARSHSPGVAPSRRTLDPCGAGLDPCAAFASVGGRPAALQAPSEAGDAPTAPRPTLDPQASTRAATAQQVARAELRRACQGREAEPLREALRSAAEAGLPHQDLAPAEAALRRLQASADLQKAAAGKSAEGLRGALRAATDAGVPREELSPGENALAALEAQEAQAQRARAELQRATQGEDAQALQDALSAAASAGVEPAELAPGQRALALLKARDELHQAIRSRDPQRLRDALQAASGGGVPAEELESARRILAALEAGAAQLQTARAGLQRAVRAREPQALQEALSSAAGAGLPFEELDQARQALDAIKAQQAARQQVHRAIASGSLGDLKEALRSATQAGVPEAELDVAASRIQLLEADGKKSAALDRLRRAIKAEDPAALRAALEMAAGLGLAGDEMDQAAHTLWALEARPAALAELRRCAARQDVPALLAAMEAAAAAGVPEGEIEAAQRTLRCLEGQQARTKAQEELRNACQSEDMEAIKLAIDSAARAGLHGPELDNATHVLREVEARCWAREGLQRAEAVARKNWNTGSIAALRSALRSAEAAGLSCRELEASRQLLQEWDAPATEPQLQVPAYALAGASSWGPLGTEPRMGTNPQLAGAYPPQAVPQTDLQTLAPGTDPQLILTAPGTTLQAAGLGAGLPMTALGTDPQMHVSSPGASGTDWSRGLGLGSGSSGSLPPTQPGLTQWRSPYDALSRGPGSSSSGILPPTQQGLTQTMSPYDALSRGFASDLQLPPTDPQLPMTNPQLVAGA